MCGEAENLKFELRPLHMNVSGTDNLSYYSSNFLKNSNIYQNIYLTHQNPPSNHALKKLSNNPIAIARYINLSKLSTSI
jgi:type IV secretory pathway component VirB8